MNLFNSQQICVFGLVLFKHRGSDSEREADAHVSSLQDSGDSGAEKGSVYTSVQLTFENDGQDQIRETERKSSPFTFHTQAPATTPYSQRTPMEGSRTSEGRDAVKDRVSESKQKRVHIQALPT